MESQRKVMFSPPDITDLEIQEVVDALRSGWITTGPKVKRLEELLAARLTVPKTVCVNSQTAAAELALRLLGVGEGDEVITCAYTYTATASVIDHVGAKIVLVDCCKDSLEIDYEALENAITPQTKAIIPIDIAGIPCDYDRIYKIVEKKRELFTPSSCDDLGGRIQRKLARVAVIADAAHALGAVYDGKPVGALADFTTFSFHAVKNFTTAEGGALAWKSLGEDLDEEMNANLHWYALHGQTKDAFTKNGLGAWEYDIVGLFYKCNMTDVMAALGIAQFARYPELLAKRRRIIERYDAALKPLGIETLAHYTEKYASSGHLYITRIPGIAEAERNEIIKKMALLGIATNVHYKPLPLLSAYKRLGFDINDYPNAYARYINEITLPLHTRLTDDDVEYVVESYAKITSEYL